jgi:hypothetical protein
VAVAGLVLPTSAAQAAITPAAGVPLMVASSNKCLNVQSGGTENSLYLIQYTCSATATNDDFRAVPMSDGTYQILAVHSGKCLNVQSGGTENSLHVVQYTCTAASSTARNDRWKVEPVLGTTRFRLRAAHSDKCLNVQGGGTADSTYVIQYACSATPAPNEQWYFPPAGTTQPQVPVDQNTATSVLQAKPTGTGLAAIEYAYTDNLGRLRHAHQTDPDSTATAEWTTVSGNQAYSGAPSLAQRPDGRVQTLGHNTDSDISLFTGTAAGAATWDAGFDTGGSTIGHPTLARLESGELVAFAVDAAGQVWRTALPATQAPFMGWRLVGGSGLTGPVSVALTTSGFRLFALDTAGTLRTATYAGGALSDWASLGGSGLTGKPAVVLYPGYRLRVFVRAADGTVLTKMQDGAGVFEADWTPVGALATKGSPAAILDPTGRTAVVVRGSDDEVYRIFETGLYTGVWGAWSRLSPDASDPTVTDPTVAPVTGQNGESWRIVFRNQNDTTRVYGREVPTAAVAKAAKEPTFTGQSLPRPPDAKGTDK